jgi:hypothetical protein
MLLICCIGYEFFKIIDGLSQRIKGIFLEDRGEEGQLCSTWETSYADNW